MILLKREEVVSKPSTVEYMSLSVSWHKTVSQNHSINTDFSQNVFISSVLSISQCFLWKGQNFVLVSLGYLDVII